VFWNLCEFLWFLAKSVDLFVLKSAECLILHLHSSVAGAFGGRWQQERRQGLAPSIWSLFDWMTVGAKGWEDGKGEGEPGGRPLVSIIRLEVRKWYNMKIWLVPMLPSLIPYYNICIEGNWPLGFYQPKGIGSKRSEVQWLISHYAMTDLFVYAFAKYHFRTALFSHRLHLLYTPRN